MPGKTKKPGAATGTLERREPARGTSDAPDGASARWPLASDAVDEELASGLRSAVTRLNRRLRQHSVGGLSPAQVSLLGTVNRMGLPTLGELAEAEQVRPPTMTRLVATLEEAGLVLRQADSSDGRVIRVRLSAEGRRTLLKIRSLKTAFLTRQLAQLSDEERQLLGRAVAVLERLTEGG